jgi:HEAT repeat protein
MIAAGDHAEGHRLRRDPGPRMLGEKETAAMLLLLKSEHGEAREFACQVLGWRRAGAAVPALIAALSDEHHQTRARAARALGRIGDERAIDPLLKRLDDPAEKRGEHGTGAREAVALALGQLGPRRAVRPLIAALKDQNPRVRRATARALGMLGDPAAADPLLPLLTDDQRRVVQEATVALGRLKATAACDRILALLDDEDSYLRAAAAEALGNIGERRAAAALGTLLAGDRDPEVREAAARALGRLGDRSALPVLRRALEDKSHPVAARAAKSLHDLKDPQGLKALLDMFASKPEKPRRHPVSSALAEMGPRAVPIILEGLADPKNRRLRENAAVAAGCVGQLCLEGVLRLLGDSRPETRRAACRALFYCPHKRAIRPLAAMLRNPRSGAGRQAAEALAAIGRPAVPELIAAAQAGTMPAMLHAVGAMARVRDVRLVPVLTRLCRHAKPNVRKAAVGALAGQPHPDALPAAVARLKDPEPEVRLEVLKLLKRRSWAAGYTSQVTALLGDSSPDIRHQAAKVLRGFDRPAALPALESRLRGEEDRRVAQAIKAAIGSIRKSEERRRSEAERQRRHEEKLRRRAEESRRGRDPQPAAASKHHGEGQERKRREEEKRKREDGGGDPEPL